MRRLGLLVAALLGVAATAFLGHGLSAGRQPHVALAATASVTVEECIEVEKGDTFTVTITVAGVTNLLAWDLYYAYDRKTVGVVGKNVRHILDNEPNSNVFDLSDPVPNTAGIYRMGAADTGGPGTMENGAGVLATLTLVAKEEGLSWSSILRDDYDGNGTIDRGPTLTAAGGQHIADTNGDSIFDGPLAAGQIAVGRSCKEPVPTPFIEEGDIVINPVLTTPAVSVVPDGTPGPEGTPADTTPTPTGAVTLATPRPGSRTPLRSDVSDPPEASSGGGLSPLLISAAAIIGGLGFTASYIMYRASRRPA